MSEEEKYLTPEEAVDLLGVSRPTFERVAKKENLRKYRKPNDRHVYYALSDVMKIKQARDEKYSTIPNLLAA